MRHGPTSCPKRPSSAARRGPAPGSRSVHGIAAALAPDPAARPLGALRVLLGDPASHAAVVAHLMELSVPFGSPPITRTAAPP